jgi:hypothetical protein
MFHRRRREVDAEDLAFDEMLADVACTAPAAAPSVSPEARSHLDSVFGSYADDSNTCACPEPCPPPPRSPWHLLINSQCLSETNVSSLGASLDIAVRASGFSLHVGIQHDN